MDQTFLDNFIDPAKGKMVSNLQKLWVHRGLV